MFTPFPASYPTYPQQPWVDTHGSLGLNLLCSPTEPLLKAWLPREAGFGNVRIHSYGYDADWQSTTAAPTINLLDFAHQLLERLLNSPHIASPGTTPIVFVAHSMGGLVVKQAYVLARQDQFSANLAKRMEAMVFLATPHRGTDLAQTLNNILRASATRFPRSFISNLSRQSELLELLNDSFRHYAPDISLFSFYESRPTELYLRSEIIVTKGSAVFGYPNERHAMLDANHRQVCKFESRTDPNYTAVREALRNITKTILERLSTGSAQETWRAMRQVESFLVMPSQPEDDLKDVEEARMAGSCEWLAEEKTSLTAMSLDCSYYFFRHGDKDKSTVSGLLRFLLYQMALRNAQVRQQLLAIIDRAVSFNKDDSKAIWRKLVWPIICNNQTPTTVHYWVIDALDECSDFELLVGSLASIEPHARIRILITSRKLTEITQMFTDLRRNPAATIAVYANEISFENTKADIQLYLDGNRHKFHVGGEKQKDAFSDRLLDKSEGCFLWARTVLDELASAWTVGEVQRILDDVPPGLDPLYLRALAIMSSRPKPGRDLARTILTWIICAVRPLSAVELWEALNLDLDDEVPELEAAIASLCAQLIHIDKTGRVMIVHLTAKTFLTNDQVQSEFRIDEKLGHHLRHATSANTVLSNLLHSFLGANVLSWIEYVASAGNLSVLTRTANSMNPYLQWHIQSSSPLGEFVDSTRNWVIDLHRIVAGFGPNLLACPWGIYWLIPPFCPKSSAVVATTAASKFGRIAVRGLKDEGWNDRMACIDTRNVHTSAVTCGDTFFAIGYRSGSITLYHNSTYLPWKTLDHGSPVYHLGFDRLSTHVVSAGRQDVKIWEVYSGFVCWTAKLDHDIMSLDITEDGKTVMIADKTHTFTSWSMRSGEAEKKVNWSKTMSFPDEGAWRRPPTAAALSPNRSLLGVLYRGRPICLYDLEDDLFHGLVSRDGDPTTQKLGSDLSPISLVFNTKRDNPKLAVAYEDGDLCLFEYEELRLLVSVEANAHSVACSPDGMTLVTGNSNGMVQLLEFDTLRLLYQVNAVDYGIRGLSFTADNLRFIDIRGTQCNVWEPAVLLGMARRDESSTEPADWEPIVKGIDSNDVNITSLELADSDQYFFVGRFDGSVCLFETSTGEQRKVFAHFGSADTVCRFMVVALLPNAELGWKATTKRLDKRADSVILQLLLNPSNDLLLVLTENSNTIWNLSTGQLVSTQTWQPPPSFCWVNQPGSSPHRLLITKKTATVFEWESSESRVTRSVNLHLTPENQTPQIQPRRVKSVFSLSQGKFLIVELSPMFQDTTTDVIVFELLPPSSHGSFLTPIDEFRELSKKVKHVIGSYGSRLLFLDSEHWVSSVDVSEFGSKYGSYLRHFPIPSEWQSQQRNLRMAATRKGDILFVRGNEVAVIGQGFEFEDYVEVLTAG
ncbi:uncharacterized protein C8A04DRAFT_35948 [Dichotomopilus funicola]|uniref:GPI inositol-deacylase n=1 Tax=Dichotomopilus funicola TaxID=1934379 RepID=A0AAN6V725_9PEZI|nr:hypothetical protein C8A04DRAFT_35948 [Dichotomopilus funicola]